MSAKITPIRFASFNASLNRSSEGSLVADLFTPNNQQARAVAEIIQRVNPDVLLINEFDYDAVGVAAGLFKTNYLSVSQNGVAPVDYPYVYVAPSNTGVSSGFDLNNNGTVGGPDDAFGFGFYPGQYGMALYSKYPIDQTGVRTFQTFLWKDMPGAKLPADPSDADGNGNTTSWYSTAELDVFRLSSKSHWDIPIQVNGETIHVLASHPTPPVFDGQEDRNGTRNYDEIRFWADYINDADYIYDDTGKAGGLAAGSRFVIMGDQNSDPFDGDSIPGAIQQLLNHPLVNTSVTPDSLGGHDAAQRQGQANTTHLSDPAYDTADFADGTPGNLRADYVLPSKNLDILHAGVFWPTAQEANFNLVGDFPFPSSDHRLVYADVAIARPGADQNRQTVSSFEFLGEVSFPTGTEFNSTVVGGLSGLAYDTAKGVFYALSDDRTPNARFYTLNIDLSDGRLNPGDITFQAVTQLRDAEDNPFPNGFLDPEGIALTGTGTLYIASEGNTNQLIDPFVRQFALTGKQISELPVPEKYRPTADRSSGIRNNLAFESLTLTPNQRYLYTATENALFQDGPAASVAKGSLSRILKYDLSTGQPVAEFVYEVEAIATPPIPDTAYADNGLVELLALDNNGTFLALERTFATGVGLTVKLYQVNTQGALDVLSLPDLFREEPVEVDDELLPPGSFDIDPAVTKTEILDIQADLGIAPDNLEAIALGPVLPDGRQSLIIVSDNNFSAAQKTQFIALALDLKTTPATLSTVETPYTVDDADSANQLLSASNLLLTGDSDDPAIWVHPTDPSQSRVFATLKDGGLVSFNLQGEIIETYRPAAFGDIRYNNVDLVYGFKGMSRMGEFRTDLAVVSDRKNDTLVILQINPETGEIHDVTSPEMLKTVFGVDDGEATVYGLATYTSPVSGKSYVFVTQASGNKVAQIELIPQIGPTDKFYVTAEVVRILELPVPTGDPEDSQSEGLVVDQELGLLYVSLENELGILRFSAEPEGGDRFTVIQPVGADYLVPDIEGLSIYYGPNGTGYLIANSQGDSSYAVFSRTGTNEYLGSFVVGSNGAIDQVNESDGLDVINVSLGSAFPNGLLVLQDGANDPQNVVQDDEQLENNSTNFKFVPWDSVAYSFKNPLTIDTTSFNPRNPQPQSIVNGVASGDVTQDSVVLWARSTFPGLVTFEYSTDADFRSIAGTATATVTDIRLPVKVLITELDARTTYYYRVIDAAGASKTGRFTTAAPLGQQGGLTFGVAGDWRGELAPYPAIANVPTRQLNFFVEHGDTIYADDDSPAVLNPDGTPKDQAITLDEYRAKHAEVYGDRFGQNFWAELRASTSIYATIDDHEVTNDFSGGERISDDPRFLNAFPSDNPNALINDSTLFENGLQAFQEYNPIRDAFYGETGDPRTSGERKLYRFNTFGSDAATFILDTRSFRDKPLVAPNVTNSTDVGRFLVESATLDRQFLGDVQLNDLKQDLLTAHLNGITWKFVMVPEPIQELGLYNVDAFEGYARERTEILQFIEANRIENVVFVAADIHATFVNNLTYQVVPGGERISTGVFEITTGSVGYDQPFGPVVVDAAKNLGLLSSTQVAFYEQLPIAPDTDDLVNDKDDFLKAAFQNLAIGPAGYDPIGLDKNLPQSQGRINARLLQGDYVVAHAYSWSEFQIDAVTQKLTVTTWGIDTYREDELLANPTAVLERTPRILSQFEVTPQGKVTLIQQGTPGADEMILGKTQPGRQVFAGDGDDEIDTSLTRDAQIYSGRGNDEITLGSNTDASGGDGIDTFLLGTLGPVGGTTVSGGNGADTLHVFEASASNTLFGGADIDELRVVESRDQLLFGGSGRDRLDASSSGGNNRLYGGSGDDELLSSGSDRLYGGTGNDTLFAGQDGNNLLWGGADADTFYLAVAGSLPDALNVVKDFELGIDRLAFGSVAPARVSLIAQDGNTLIKVGDAGVALVEGVTSALLSITNANQFIFTNSLA
jgi:myo-inositol-hexaphosphate 3-phosphohydrolase/phosphodiesterase/alkaline phosphatase D-like protein